MGKVTEFIDEIIGLKHKEINITYKKTVLQ